MMPTESILERPMIAGSQLAEALARRVSPSTVIRTDEPLAKHTTLRVGGRANAYVEPVSTTDLGAMVRYCHEVGMPFFVLGRGSNLLVRDGNRLCCGAGAKLKDVAIEAKRQHLSGVEFLEGIPGSVGGALRMNAGAMGSQTFDLVESVRLMDFTGNIREFTPKEMTVAYRGCATLKDHIALSAVFQCRAVPRQDIETRMKEFSEKRWASQPAAPSAGCIFKNPAGIPAGKLVEELGLKGTRVGGAVVSAEHGNFIVNDGSATARDILELIDLLKQRARAERGIELETEVEIIGEE
jgi:UDP-N-acetylenolpyruvoylglucosamine reductase